MLDIGVTMRATDPKVLTTREVKVVRAIGQTLFPRDRNVDLDALDVGVTEYIDAWLALCGTIDRAQFHALLQAFDTGYAVWARSPSAGIETASLDDRRAYLDSWERSQTYLQRQLWEGLRSMFLFAYVDAEEVLDAIGVRDPETVEVDPVPLHETSRWSIAQEG